MTVPVEQDIRDLTNEIQVDLSHNQHEVTILEPGLAEINTPQGNRIMLRLEGAEDQSVRG